MFQGQTAIVQVWQEQRESTSVTARGEKKKWVRLQIHALAEHLIASVTLKTAC